MKAVRNILAVSLCAVVGLSACKDKTTPADDQQKHIAEVVAAGGVVDSIIPIAEALNRFRATITDKTDTLRHSSNSVNALITRWTLAVATNDTALLNAMLLDRSEFAWLYYPTSKMSQPPYEAPSQLLWGQMLATSEEGAQSTLKKFSTGSFKVAGIRCPKPPVIEGANKLHEGCLLTLEQGGITSTEAAYFGTIIERDGRFKFVSYASRL